MTNKEILQDAKQVLETLPAEKWTTHVFATVDGKFCALGFYAIRENSSTRDERPFTDEESYRISSLRQASIKAMRILHGKSLNIADVNNAPTVNGYTEPEIKDRVMHFLEDAVKIEEDF